MATNGAHPGESLLTPQQWEVIGKQFRLTKRELTVAVLIFEGRTRRQIAYRLDCAPGTVRTYIDRLFAKLEVTDRLGMALRVVRVTLMSEESPNLSHKSATC